VFRSDLPSVWTRSERLKFSWIPCHALFDRRRSSEICGATEPSALNSVTQLPCPDLIEYVRDTPRVCALEQAYAVAGSINTVCGRAGSGRIERLHSIKTRRTSTSNLALPATMRILVMLHIAYRVKL
jgi:hypothetical protein